MTRPPSDLHPLNKADMTCNGYIRNFYLREIFANFEMTELNSWILHPTFLN